MRPDPRRLGGEFVRFCITGLLAVLLNTGLIVAFTEVAGMHYLASIVLTFAVTTLFGFALNRQWTFAVDGAARRRELMRYAAISLFGVGLTLVTAWLLVGWGVPYYVASFGVAVLLAPVNFLLHRGWSFGLAWVDAQRGRPA